MLLCPVNPASAASISLDEFDPLALVLDENLLFNESSFETATPSRLNESPEGASSISEIDIQPVSTVAPFKDTRTGALVVKESSHGYVTGKGTNGLNASFVVIADKTSPSTHEFTIGNEDNSLQLQDDGSVIVYGADGTQTNYILAPWAKDAEGKDLDTYYTLEGNALKQHIDLSDAAFPVIADPSTGCGVGWCSVYFNLSETNAIAAGGAQSVAAIAAGCFVIGGAPAAAACTAISGPVVAVAHAAKANKNCVGIIGYGLPPYSGWGPFVEPRGTSHCR